MNTTGTTALRIETWQARFAKAGGLSKDAAVAAEVAELRTALTSFEQTHFTLVGYIRGLSQALLTVRDMVGHPDAITFINRVLADPETPASIELPAGAAANVAETEGYFAWAAFAKNGNVIIWSRQRDQVKRVADHYCTPIRPVVVLHRVENAAARDILAERRRQVEQEGYAPEHDDDHIGGESAAYAAFYAMPPAARDWPATETGYGKTFGEAIVPADWKVPKEGDRRSELLKAGALILAEIERLDRAAILNTEKS